MRLRDQAISVGVMHGAAVLQPLLILPYAGRVLGPHYFGLYAYAMTIEQLLVTIVEYGFQWTAQRTAASARHEPAVISSLFADVFAAKCVLLVPVTVIGLAIATPVLGISNALFMCLLLGPIGGIAFPSWLFIGIEQAWHATAAVVSARLIALVCFVVMVKSPTQLNIAVAVQSGIPLVSGVVSLPFLSGMTLRGFRSLTAYRVHQQLVRGWRGFLFTLSERIFTILPLALVAHLAGYDAAGQFSVAEKFVTATRSMFRVMIDTLSPRVAYYAKHEPIKGIRLIKRSFLTLGGSAVISLSLCFIAPRIIILFFGPEFSPAIPIVQIMSVIPLLLNANICLSSLYMFNYGHERVWSFLTVGSLVCFISIAYPGAIYTNNPTMAVVLAMIAKEAITLVVAAFFFARYAGFRGQPRSHPDREPALARWWRPSVKPALIRNLFRLS